MKIQLSEHFTYSKLLRFVFPSIVMMIFTSIYGVVDGIFVSNYVGSTSFAAVNLIWPFVMATGAVGFMLGTGGSAIVAKTMGEGKEKRANEYFSMLIYVNAAAGILLSIIGFFFIRPITQLLGARETLLEEAVLYGRILLLGNAAFMLQNSFQSFFPVAEKPQTGLLVTVAAGITNMVMDYLLIAVFQLGLIGAAAATVLSYFVGGILPIFYFAKKNPSRLKLVKTKFYGRELLKSCTNGSSEMMSNLSMSIVNMLYNLQLIKIAGENGVAAYGVIMYVNFIFVAVFIGYAIGSAPIIGFHYGSGNQAELKNLFKKSLVIILVGSVSMTGLAEISALPLSKIFVGYDEVLLEMTQHGFCIFSLSFLFSGFNIFSSAFFTALNNGAVSAAISFLRTLIFQIISVIALPILFGIDGIWMAVVVAEILAMCIAAILLLKKRKTYHYL